MRKMIIMCLAAVVLLAGFFVFIATRDKSANTTTADVQTQEDDSSADAVT